MSEVIGSVTLSIDDDGFLRRACPHCEREFKWLHGDRGEPMPSGGYHCPYCDGRSDDGWWTKPQLATIEGQAGEYMEGQLHDMLKPLKSSSSEFLKISVSHTPRSPVPVDPDEPNDMQRVDFPCHPTEPVKVLETWDDSPYCLICGKNGRSDPGP